MTERELIIKRLAGCPDDEARPEFYRIACNALEMRAGELSDHPLYKDGTFIRKTDALRETFERAFHTGRLEVYYNTLSPESLIECFDNWCCSKYR